MFVNITLPRRIDTGVYHRLRSCYQKTKHKVNKENLMVAIYIAAQSPRPSPLCELLVCPPLEDLVYERTAPSQRFASSLWSFHPRKSLEDLNQSLQAEDYSIQCSVLHTFLKLVRSLPN